LAFDVDELGCARRKNEITTLRFHHEAEKARSYTSYHLKNRQC
jgi:hypothetical protein